MNDNTEFVKQVYRDFLNREADPGGLSYWSNQLNTGVLDRSELVEQYLLSPEFGEKVSPVTRLYFAYFNRLPDYSGLMYWVNEYASGNRTLNNISDAFAASTEFQMTYGSLNNGQFVDLIYTNLFNRSADPGGKAYWTSELDSGNRTRGQVMVGFSESQEYKDLMANPIYVTMTYIGLLRRAPDQSGFNYWVGVMNQGGNGLALIDSFLVSVEYQARFEVNYGPAEGLYTGLTSNNRQATGLVLNDGTFYFLYSMAGWPDVIGGVVQGSVQTSNGTLSSTNAKDFNLEGLGVLGATVAANYSSKNYLKGSVSYSSGGVVSFDMNYDKAYETAPSLTTVSGNYVGDVATSVGWEDANISISSSGAISGVGASGCKVSGLADERTSGNVYDIRITFGGYPCLFAYQMFNGIAYYDATDRWLYAAAPNSSRTDGVLFTGQKQ